MDVQQLRITVAGKADRAVDTPLHDAQLVMVFGSRDRLIDTAPFRQIRELYPDALIVGCSTAGEVLGCEVLDETLSVTAVRFSSTQVHAACRSVSDPAQSMAVGRQLAAELRKPDLKHVLVFSDGLGVNGSQLAAGLAAGLPTGVVATGGLAGDADRFEQTLVIAGGQALSDTVVAVGLSGPDLQVGHGSLGGWDSFGHERVVTKSDDNVLYELDGHSALDLYKTYLGDHADGLPATGLLFPLSVRASDGGEEVVRTLLAVDEDAGSMTFAGDIPEGSYARLMMANFDRLIDGAGAAAVDARTTLAGMRSELGILISCVGRKLVLSQRVEEEVESVQAVLGPGVPLTGFYSYGEISPLTPGASCELHNQTMTITALAER